MSNRLEKVFGRGVEEKSILESRFIPLEETQIIFVMLSIFSQEIFQTPLISTGTHFISFYLEKHGFEE
jgi:hypothetical protein